MTRCCFASIPTENHADIMNQSMMELIHDTEAEL